MESGGGAVDDDNERAPHPPYRDASEPGFSKGPFGFEGETILRSEIVLPHVRFENVPCLKWLVSALTEHGSKSANSFHRLRGVLVGTGR